MDPPAPHENGGEINIIAGHGYLDPGVFYNCGLGRSLENETGFVFPTGQLVTCQWNREWSKSEVTKTLFVYNLIVTFRACVYKSKKRVKLRPQYVHIKFSLRSACI